MGAFHAMIAWFVAAQLLVAPAVPADTGAMSAMSAMSATHAIDQDRTQGALNKRPLVPEGDAWLGADKFKHAAMSYAITAYTFAATDSEPAAVASGAIAGILKEIYDRRRGSLFSVRDLVWDAAGVALAYAVVKQTRY
jgi:uncharacterized protein YfiM (DUF2279 family)